MEFEPVVARNPYKPPGPPSTPEVSAITKDSMVVTWGRPEDNGGAEIEGYILEKRDKDGVRWTKCNKKRLTDLRFRVTGLTDGHFYEFRVSAENAAGVGEPSEPSISIVLVMYYIHQAHQAIQRLQILPGHQFLLPGVSPFMMVVLQLRDM